MNTLSIHQCFNQDSNTRYRFLLVDGCYLCETSQTQLDLSIADSVTKRLLHTFKWCKANHRGYSYYHTLIDNDQENARVLNRKISVIIREEGNIELAVSVAREDDSVLRVHNLNDSILNGMSDAILLTEADIIEDPGPRIIYCNNAYVKVSGYAKHEVLGKSPRILQGEATSNDAKKNIKLALLNWESITQRIVNYKKDGSKFIVELNISPVMDETGWYTHWLSVQRDVSSEQADIELVRQSRFILESNHIACWYYNITDDHCYFDKAMMRLHHTKERDFDSKLSTWCGLIYKKDVGKFRSTLAQSITQHRSLDVEYRVSDHEGSVRLLKLNSRLLVDELTGKEMLAGTCFDVTDERNAEQEIERHRKVAIENSKLASIGQLASGVGHEINNPLSVITASIEVAEAKLELEPEALVIAQPWFRKIDKACMRIAKIVDGLRSVSNINRELSGLEPVNLYTHGLETFGLFKNLLEAEGITLHICIEADIDTCWFIGDYAKYQQVLVNLLNNAKDALSDSAQKDIHCTISSTKGLCELLVTDTGCGIKPEDAGRIFDPFVTTKPVGKGTGLGLSITQSIVRLFSGEITLANSDVNGTSFRVQFPRSEASMLKLESDDSIHCVDKTVLLVEDEVEVGDCAQELLELLNCNVTRAENGKNAIELIKTMPFDIILVDLKMPVLNGWEFLETLKALKLATDARKYVLTGEIISQTDPQFKRLYKLANGVIQKPIRKIDLAKVLRLDKQDWTKGQ